MATTRTTLYTLQIFRGLAAIMVLLAHAQMYVRPGSSLKVFEPGTSGVVFFFVLSGFIICYSNYEKIGKGTGQISFILNRVRRIYPIYWAYTATILAVSYLMYLKTGSVLVDSNSYRISDYFKSFFLFPYSKVGDQWPFIPVAWTLSYEMLFYLAFSAAIFLKSRYSLLLIGVFLLLLSFSALDVMGFLFGCIIVLMVKHAPRGKIAGISAMIIGFALLVVSWGLTYAGLLRYHRLITFGIPYALLIWGAATTELAVTPRIKTSRIGKAFVYLGDASYSLYLVHYWTLALLSILLASWIGNNALLFGVISMFATAIGLLAYRYAEKPLLQGLRTIGVRTTHQSIQPVTFT